MQAAVLAVQAGWRMYRCRSAYLRLRHAAVLSQVSDCTSPSLHALC